MLNMSFISKSVRKDSEGAGCAPAKMVQMSFDFQPANHAEVVARPASCDYVGAARRAGFDSDAVLNPCKGCPLSGLCSDECAQLGFAIDVNDPIKAGWRLKSGFKFNQK